ncbi:MAG: alpha/beta hydrolase [Phenylobacterium sp.]
MAGSYQRIPYLIVFDESAAFKDTYSGQIGRVALDAFHLKPDTPSNTVIIFSHPIGGGAYLPLPNALARAGVHVIYLNTRYRGTDAALIMEKTLVDLGACVRDAKTRLGYERVYLGGWSGGGSMSLFYQSQATAPDVRATPAGDGPDLTKADLIPADGIMLLASHLSRNLTLTEWMDASVTDEARPFDRDPSLNLYAEGGPKPPYDAAFLARYAEAQIARNRRITAWVKHELQTLKDQGRENEERAFVVHGTMAAPCFLDPLVDPNERRPGWCYLGDPRLVNDGPVGLARFSTLRSWLSQWSYDDSNADGLKCAARLTGPLLVIENGADDACTPSHAARLCAAATQATQTFRRIDHANHYYFGQPELAHRSAGVVIDWMAAQC